MAQAPKTVFTYPLNGTQRDFPIAFEYLARKFVRVTLLGANARKELVLNTDYRFTTKVQITTTQAWGTAEGYDTIEIRRYTSAEERLVDFNDGSILRAFDLNLSQIQTLHVAEEARDLTADTIGVNQDGDLDARGRKIINLANGINDTDAANVGQLRQFDTSTANNADRAEAAKNRAVQAETNTARDSASASVNATKAVASAGTAVQAASDANRSKTAAEAAESHVVPLVPIVDQAAKDAADAAAKAEQAVIDVKNLGAVPIGTIVEFLIGKDTAGYLLTNGGTFDEATYPDLFTYLGTNRLPLREHEYRIGDVKWFPKRSAIDPDFIPADGDLLKRSDYPQIESALIKDAVHQTSDSQYSNDPKYRGFWMTDLPDFFRTPDMNGKTVNSEGALFIRGDGKNSNGSDNAIIQGDAMRNLTADFGDLVTTGDAFATGAVKIINDAVHDLVAGSGGTVERRRLFQLNASLQVPTAPEFRSVNLAGCWGIRVKYSTQFYIKAAGVVADEGLAQVDGIIQKNVEQDERLAVLEAPTPCVYAKMSRVWALSPNQRAYIPFSEYITDIEGFVVSGSGFKAQKDGLYRIQCSITRDGDVYQKPSAHVVILNGSTAAYSEILSYLYSGGTGGSGAVGDYGTVTGHTVLRLKAGQTVAIQLSANNNLPAKLWDSGNNLEIVYLKP